MYGRTLKPVFYRELMTVLSKVNSTRPKDEQLSFTKVVHEGMGLKQTFTTKIRSGIYRPTLDRLVSLGNFLGVHPATFSDYVERFSDEYLIREDSNYRDLVKLLASVPEESRSEILKRLLEAAKGAARESRSAA